MADPRRFGRSERKYTGVTDRMGSKYDRFGPSEKRYSEAHYTPSGLGKTWGYTGDFRRKIPGYDVGARPPRGLESLIAKQGMIGIDPRSSSYGDKWASYYGTPEDMSGYRRSVAEVAAANAEEERNRLNEKYRYAFTNPGSGMGIEEQYVGYPAGMADYLGIEEHALRALPKDPRDTGTMSEIMYDWPGGPWWGATDDMSDYRQSGDPHMTEQTALNLKLLADTERMGTGKYWSATTPDVSIGEREAFRSPPRYQELFDKWTKGAEAIPMGMKKPWPGWNRGGIASLRR